MFFDKEIISFNLLDVLELNNKSVDKYNEGRNFEAISFRTSSNAILKTDKNEYRLGDNYVTFFPARLNYRRIADTDKLIVIHFDSTEHLSDNIEFFEAKDPERFEKLFREILQCWNQKEIGYKYKCSALLYEIFAECYARNFRQRGELSKIQASVDYLNKSYKKSDLTIKEIAEKSFVSEVYFRKLFKAEYGVSPQKYIVELRLQRAAGLISTGYYSLKEVALMSGYTDYKYFSVEFKRNMGVSPSEYSYNYRK